MGKYRVTLDAESSKQDPGEKYNGRSGFSNAGTRKNGEAAEAPLVAHVCLELQFE